MKMNRQIMVKHDPRRERVRGKNGGKKNKTGTEVPASQCRKESTIFNENILRIIVTIATGQER